MYKYSEPDVNQLEIFEKSLPFGGKLDRNNRWIRLAELVNWRELELNTFNSKFVPEILAKQIK